MISFKVADMTCGHCVKAITHAVTSIDGQSQVAVDLNRKLVSIESATGTEEQFRAAIAEAGYTPVAHR